MKSTISFNQISKKFSQSYVSDSLRDTLSMPFKRIFSKNDKCSLSSKDFWALKDVSFSVNSGEVLGIIGPNGSGKTTTLKLLSKILRPDKGEIVVQGRIGSLIELAAGINPEFNGRENIFLNGAILGMSNEEIKSKYNQIVEFSELHEFMDTPVKWYSSGMLARLAFSVAAHTEPEVLLVDEILSVGDMGFQKKCFELMKAFKDKGTTLVFVSHNLQAVASLCDRVILLSDGVVKCEGDAEYTIDKYLNSITPNNVAPDNETIPHLLKGEFYNGSGELRTHFTTGEKGMAIVKILFNRDYSDIVITNVIRSSSETMVFRTNTNRLGGETISVKKGQSVEFSIDLSFYLAPGIYDLRYGVFDKVKQKWIAMNQKVTSFIIHEDPRFEGIANLEPKLKKLNVS